MSGKRDWPVIEDPVHWREPRMVFVCSMGDIFHENVPDRWIDRVFHIMTSPFSGANHHTYMLLTKRPERILRDAQFQRFRQWHNIWLGVTAENQAQANARIPILVQIPATVRFVSVEPMLEPVQMRRSVLTCGAGVGSVPSGPPAYRDENWLTGYVGNSDHKGKGAGFCDGLRLDWVIAGPETGPGARLCEAIWIEDLAAQCGEAGVPFFDKRKTGWLRREWPDNPVNRVE
jgi:protein gp37